VESLIQAVGLSGPPQARSPAAGLPPRNDGSAPEPQIKTQ